MVSRVSKIIASPNTHKYLILQSSPNLVSFYIPTRRQVASTMEILVVLASCASAGSHSKEITETESELLVQSPRNGDGDENQDGEMLVQSRIKRQAYHRQYNQRPHHSEYNNAHNPKPQHNSYSHAGPDGHGGHRHESGYSGSSEYNNDSGNQYGGGGGEESGDSGGTSHNDGYDHDHETYDHGGEDSGDGDYGDHDTEGGSEGGEGGGSSYE